MALARLLDGNEAACAAAGRAGAGKRLVGVLRSTAGPVGGEREHMLQEYAVLCLAMVCQEPTGASTAVRSRGVPLLVGVLGMGGETAMDASVALWHLARQDHSHLQAVAAAGCIPGLVSSVHALTASKARCAIRLLCSICEQLPEHHQEVRAAGGVQALQQVEQAGSDAAAEPFELARRALDCLLPNR